MPVCRCCDFKNDKLIPLFSLNELSEDLSTIFSIVTDIKVIKNDGHPDHICELCLKKLRSSYVFKTQCQKLDLRRQNEMASIASNSLLPIAITIDLESKSINTNKQNVTKSFDNIEHLLIKEERTDHFLDNELMESATLQDISKSSNKPPIPDIKNCHDPNATAKLLQEILYREGSKKLKHKLFACLLCEDVFTKSEFLTQHISEEHCDKNIEETVERQIDTQTQKITEKRKKLVCAVCKEYFTSQLKLKKHVVDSHFPLIATEGVKEKSLQCTFCHETVNNILEWKNHQKTHANEIKPFRCNFEGCKASFKNRSALNSHSRTHTQDRPYQCNYCTKRFNQKSNAIAHERLHTGAKPYLCSECGRAFRESGNLTQHMRQHTGEKPFACHLCPKHFSTLYSRKVHIRTHLQDKPYLCSECGKSFVASGKLLIHKRIHSGYRPYICKLCSSAFHDGNGLKRHMKTH